jgi:5'-nucleotidase
LKRILVTNDDGIDSKGLQCLAEAISELGEIYIIAPGVEMSAASHSLTLHRPLSYKKIGDKKYKIYGTPSDCVYLGVVNIIPSKTDLIVSGINIGSNMGDDITYSGTVSAAMEGMILGVPSIAFSLYGSPPSRFDQVIPYCRAIARAVLENSLPRDTFLNVNFPDESIKGYLITSLGRRHYEQKVHEIKDPRGNRYYWIGGEKVSWETIEGSDFEAVRNGYVSITPLHLDLTNVEFIDKLKSWTFKI